MNLVLAEIVKDTNGTRCSITTLPDSFNIAVTFDDEGTCNLTFLKTDGSPIMTTAIETCKELKEIALHTEKRVLKRIAHNMLAIINYDLLYFITHGSYEDNDLNELPNKAIFSDGIKALDLNYIKTEWLTDLEFEYVSNIRAFSEVMRDPINDIMSKSNNTNKKKS